jgi:hypothetical protein
MVRPALPVVVLLALVPALAAQQQPAPVVRMADQFEKVHDVRDHRGDVVVFLYGDRRSADANKALGALLHVAFHPQAAGLPPPRARAAPVRPVAGAPAGARSPDVLTVPVACVGAAPLFVRSILRAQFRAASAGVPVWLDFTDQMKRQFNLRPGVPNVVVFDTLGRYRYTAAGPLSPAETQRLVDAVEALRREAVRGP